MEVTPSTSPSPATSQPSPSSTLVPEERRGKLFVGGITSDTTELVLKEHFGKYGEVKDAVVIRNRDTGVGRGFGFVEFVEAEAANAALEEESHVICGRMVEVRRAMPRGNQNQSRSQCQAEQCRPCGEKSKKLFVGGLPESLTLEEFRSYFERFGTVTDSIILYDNENNKPRGFGFITFDSETAVDNVRRNGDHKLNGKSVDVKEAIPKDRNNCRSIVNGEINNYGARGGFRGEPAFCGYQGGFYPPFAPRAPYFHGPSPWPSYFYGGIHFNGYYDYGYGSHYTSPRVPWSGHPPISSNQVCFPYDNSMSYPHFYQNGAFGGNMDIADEYDTESIKDDSDELDTQATNTCKVSPQSEESVLPHTSAAEVNVGISESVALPAEDAQAEVCRLGHSPSEVDDIIQEMADLQVKDSSK